MNYSKLKKSILIAIILILAIYLYDFREQFVDGLLIGLGLK